MITGYNRDKPICIDSSLQANRKRDIFICDILFYTFLYVYLWRNIDIDLSDKMKTTVNGQPFFFFSVYDYNETGCGVGKLPALLSI